VRRALFWLLLIATSVLPCLADESVVHEFSGAGGTTTGLFKVQDRWEVRWNARQVVSIAVMAPDGTIVTGAAGVLRGSLFVPTGGQYYLKIAEGVQEETAPVYTPAPILPGPGGTAPLVAPTISWHLQIVQLDPAPATNPALTVFAPFFVVPDSAILPAITPPAPPPPKLTDSQVRAIVTIQGDNAKGSGFLVHTAKGYFAVTHLHLLAANPNVQIFTSSGELITVLSLKGAVDRDLALLAIKDNHYSYLPLASGDSALEAGDEVIIPDITGIDTAAASTPPPPSPPPPSPPIPTATNATPTPAKPLPGATNAAAPIPPTTNASPGATNTAASTPPPATPAPAAATPFGTSTPPGAASTGAPSTSGKVTDIGPDRLYFDNVVDAGSLDAPVILVKGGNVVGIVTAPKRPDVSRQIAKVWAANPVPGVDVVDPFYALRLPDVPGWQTYDPTAFLAESLFLKGFNHTTRCLDSYLNGWHREWQGGSNEVGAPDSRYYLSNAKLRAAQDTYRQQAADADMGQQLDATRELLLDLEGVADTDMKTLQGRTLLYSYDQNWAQEELAYRKALKTELEEMESNLGHLNDIAHSR
jgi:hypothetical protein